MDTPSIFAAPDALKSGADGHRFLPQPPNRKSFAYPVHCARPQLFSTMNHISPHIHADNPTTPALPAHDPTAFRLPATPRPATTTHFLRRALSCLAAIAILCSLNACADLTEVRQFAALSSSIEKFPVSEDDITTTYDNLLSLHRERAILSGKTVSASAQKEETVETAKLQEDRIALVKVFNTANSVLVAYLNALGELVDNKTHPEIGKYFEPALKDLRFMDSKIEEKDIGNLANLLVAKTFDGYRGKKANEFILEGKDAFIAIVNGLGPSVETLKKNFEREKQELSLSKEENYYFILEKFYNTSTKTPLDLAAITWIRQQRLTRIKELNEKTRAIEEYVRNLGKIKNKLEKLLENNSPANK